MANKKVILHEYWQKKRESIGLFGNNIKHTKKLETASYIAKLIYRIQFETDFHCEI